MGVTTSQNMAVTVIHHKLAFENNDSFVLFRVRVPGAPSSWLDLRLEHGRFIGSERDTQTRATQVERFVHGPDRTDRAPECVVRSTNGASRGAPAQDVRVYRTREVAGSSPAGSTERNSATGNLGIA